MKRLVIGLWLIAFGVFGVRAATGQDNVQFSGQAFQSSPDGRQREAKVFVGDNQVRLEYQRGDMGMVEIYDMKNQRVVLLVPQQKIYMQRDMPSGQAVNPMLPPRDSNPCSVMPEGRCRKLGAETLFGRPVSQWEVFIDRQGKTLRSLHWIDDERMMSLRDVWPDGSVSELTLQGSEQREGRATERWQRITKRADGKSEVATQWFDLELQIAIREELPGGYFREIKQVRVAEQPNELFQVPADYRRVENGVKN